MKALTDMTRGRKLLLLLLCLIALTAAALLATRLAPSEETAEDTTFVIFSLDPDQVTDLSWTYDGSTVTLQKDGESNWSYPDEAFPLDAAYPDAMVQALSEVEAAKTPRTWPPTAWRRGCAPSPSPPGRKPTP